MGMMSSLLCQYMVVSAASMIVLTLAPAASAHCLGTVVVDGDENLVSQIDAWRADQSANAVDHVVCPESQLQIAQNGADEISLELYEDGGLKYRRTVASMDTALVLLESWFEQEIPETLLKPERDQKTARSQTDEQKNMTPQAPPVPKASQRPEKGGEPVNRNEIWGAVGLWISHGQFTWLGVDAGYNRRIGRLRPGVLARYGNLMSEIDSSGPFGTQRALAALITIDYPLAAGNLSLYPGVGFGGMLVTGPKRSENRDTVYKDRFGTLQIETYIRAGMTVSKHFKLNFCARFSHSLPGDADDQNLDGYEARTHAIWFIRFSLGIAYEW